MNNIQASEREREREKEREIIDIYSGEQFYVLCKSISIQRAGP